MNEWMDGWRMRRKISMQLISKSIEWWPATNFQGWRAKRLTPRAKVQQQNCENSGRSNLLMAISRWMKLRGTITELIPRMFFNHVCILGGYFWRMDQAILDWIESKKNIVPWSAINTDRRPLTANAVSEHQARTTLCSHIFRSIELFYYSWFFYFTRHACRWYDRRRRSCWTANSRMERQSQGICNVGYHCVRRRVVLWWLHQCRMLKDF